MMTDQTSARTRLAAELAVGLARRFSMTLEPGETPGYYWHFAQTPFEDGCYVLWRLGVALAESAVSRQGVTWKQIAVAVEQHTGEEENYATYKFFPAAETRAGVLAYGELPAGLFERLLDCYVE